MSWENWTFEYPETDKEELIKKMNKAFKKMIFRPPLPPGPYQKVIDCFDNIERLLRKY